MTARRAVCTVVAILLLGVPGPAALAENPPSKFRDPQDGAFDVSGWLASKTGFLPVFSVITEPAVGYGGALALVFFHGGGGLGGAAQRGLGVTGKPVPPSVSAVGGLATENGTWGAFAGHMGYWKGDRWRYLGGLVRAEPTLDYYGRGGQPYEFTMDSWGIFQELTGRVGKTDLFAGARFVYLDSEVRFNFERVPPDLPTPQINSTIGGLGAVIRYDTRNNIFTPSRGMDLLGVGTFYGSWLGSDRTFQDYQMVARLYRDVHPRVVLAGQARAEMIAGEPPFYSKPFIHLRGIPAMRYQDDTAASVEAEVRWNVYKRWWAVGFGGAGWTGEDWGSLGDSDSVQAGGVGFRYLLARALGIQMGLDVAWGPEDTAFYVVFGSSF
ncbi:MAG: hypothetical protein MUF10_02945 [Thermoanaerobaculaceae bacterium]|nr:hypothetical protein [Thermoanaerobaculaceae bacterium]